MRPGWLQNRSRRGFTLVELLVALAITSTVGSVVSTGIHQVFTNHARSTAHMAAIADVENAIHYLSRDVQQAQVLDLGASAGFPLNLTWVDWGGVVNQVTYTIVGDELQRAYSTGGAPTTRVVARHIDPANTALDFQLGVFDFRITSWVGGTRPSTETRVGEIIPRSAQ